MDYKIIKATEEHFDQIIPLLFATGYYEYAALNNKLNLIPKEFHKVQTLKPYLNHMYVLVNNIKVIGFYIAVTKKQLDKIDKNTPNWYRDDPELMQVIDQIMSFYQKETLENDLISLNAAIHPQYRGQGLYQLIKDHRTNLAKQQQCTRIIFGTWSSNPAHIILKRYGAQYLGEIECTIQSIHDYFLKGAFVIDA
jgi:hypothetical protein